MAAFEYYQNLHVLYANDLRWFYHRILGVKEQERRPNQNAYWSLVPLRQDRLSRLRATFEMKEKTKCIQSRTDRLLDKLRVPALNEFPDNNFACDM